MEPVLLGTFHNAETGETYSRQLTPEEIAELPESVNTPEAPNGD